MADEILKCDGTDEIQKPEWPPIVGEKTLADGGHVGDLLELARVHLEDAKRKGELREQDAGAAYTAAILEAFKTAVTFELAYSKSQMEVCFLKAQIDKLVCDCNNDTKRTDSQILVDAAQISKLECDCDNDTKRTDSQVEVNDSKIKLDEAQINNLICDCENDTNATDSKISLNAAQENKLACDCCNNSLVSSAQSDLYRRQAEGFDDNANQKLYDSQLQAWSMVFADTDLTEVTDSINEENVNATYKRLCKRLASGAGETCQIFRMDEDGTNPRWEN